MFLCSSYASLDGSSTCVETAEIRTSTKRLFTSFVYSCSVLTFEYVDLNTNTVNYFLAHVDALGEHMKDRLKSKLMDLPMETVKELNLYYGPLCIGSCKKDCRCKSMNIIKDVIAELNLNNKIINEKNLKVWQTEVSIPSNNYNNNGTSEYSDLKLANEVDRIFLGQPTFRDSVQQNIKPGGRTPNPF